MTQYIRDKVGVAALFDDPMPVKHGCINVTESNSRFQTSPLSRIRTTGRKESIASDGTFRVENTKEHIGLPRSDSDMQMWLGGMLVYCSFS